MVLSRRDRPTLFCDCSFVQANKKKTRSLPPKKKKRQTFHCLLPQPVPPKKEKRKKQKRKRPGPTLTAAPQNKKTQKKKTSFSYIHLNTKPIPSLHTKENTRDLASPLNLVKPPMSLNTPNKQHLSTSRTHKTLLISTISISTTLHHHRRGRCMVTTFLDGCP